MTENTLQTDPDCLFCKIAVGKIPSKMVYQDDEFYAFHDIHPSAPVHFLIIPRLHIRSMALLTDAHAPMMGRMMALIPKLALQTGCRPYPAGGFRMVCNTGADGAQDIHHLHIHIMGGPRPWLRG